MDVADLQHPRKRLELQRKWGRLTFGTLTPAARRKKVLALACSSSTISWLLGYLDALELRSDDGRRGSEEAGLPEKVKQGWIDDARKAKQRRPDRGWSDLANEIRRKEANKRKLQSVNDLPRGYSLTNIRRTLAKALGPET